MTYFTPPAGSIPTLEVPTLDGVRSVHLIGIGGAGMRNLADCSSLEASTVSGSDLKDSKGLRELAGAGADVWVGHDGVADERDRRRRHLVRDRRIQPRAGGARERGIPVWARQQALAALATAIGRSRSAGPTGRPPRPRWWAVVLERAGLDPSYLIGGDLNESGSGARSGSGDLFVFEADESDGSFLLARPAVGIITNVEVDHVDFYTGGP